MALTPQQAQTVEKATDIAAVGVLGGAGFSWAVASDVASTIAAVVTILVGLVTIAYKIKHWDGVHRDGVRRDGARRDD
jgi:hypothetical protein